jgi:uncharacterized ferredoxin-like protein
MRNVGEIRDLKFFFRETQIILKIAMLVFLIASKKEAVVGLNCGGCGFNTCDGVLEKQENPALIILSKGQIALSK